MFTPSRYIVIDDNLDELRELVDALHHMGAPAIGIHYDAAKGVKPELLAGARVLFLDLHLIGGVQIGDQKKAFDVVINILEEGIGPASGPYVVVLWTKHAEQHAEFEAHLIDRLSPEKRPLAILHLDKNDYLRAGQKVDGDRLRKDITAAIATDPRLHALLSWEHDVLAAAGATLSELGALIPPEKRTPALYGEQLDQLLSVLAGAAAGVEHAKADIRAAVGEALTPLLGDRLRNQRSSDADAELWNRAVTKIDEVQELQEADAARLNTMLHLSRPPNESIRSTDWGAVVGLPEGALSDAAMKARFGITFSALRLSSYPVHRKQDRKHCIPVLVRIGAACDYAQNRSGPIPYVFGALVPASLELRDSSKLSPALIDSPVLEFPGTGAGRLFVDARYQISLTGKDVADWEAICRVREQMLMLIAGHSAGYAMRPGIISIRSSVPPPDGDEG
jgi:hypothetical protein